ncbi:MAG: hypothetical protein AUG44_22880 [Actinobacteria bacterium 13_1_20CM_3_71_11]|nr:MAG: hypothetical protein AUG44_22880 [Actinobacteria bacterium 13_1_20CM_3_71_11]
MIRRRPLLEGSHGQGAGRERQDRQRGDELEQYARAASCHLGLSQVVGDAGVEKLLLQLIQCSKVRWLRGPLASGGQAACPVQRMPVAAGVMPGLCSHRKLTMGAETGSISIDPLP